jgi:GAF domain-containing protein
MTELLAAGADGTNPHLDEAIEQFSRSWIEIKAIEEAMRAENVRDKLPRICRGVRPFTDKQIALVETFADQAAIAIENVRLFHDIQNKSRQLAEASPCLTFSRLTH